MKKHTILRERHNSHQGSRNAGRGWGLIAIKAVRAGGGGGGVGPGRIDKYLQANH